MLQPHPASDLPDFYVPHYKKTNAPHTYRNNNIQGHRSLQTQLCSGVPLALLMTPTNVNGLAYV